MRQEQTMYNKQVRVLRLNAEINELHSFLKHNEILLLVLSLYNNDTWTVISSLLHRDKK